MFKRFSFIAVCLFAGSLAVAQAPANAVNFYNAGLGYAAKGIYPQAIISFKKAISAYKIYDQAYAELGNAYYKNNNPDSALLSYKAAVNINPKMVNIHIVMANIYRDVKKQPDDAIGCYMNALKAGDNSKETYYGLAWCYNDKKEYDKAIPYAIKALEIDNSYKAAYNELGHAYNKTKKYEEGLAQFKKNMAVSTVDLQYYYSGLCYIELKDKAGALKMQNDLVTINPKLADALTRRINAAAF